MKKFAQKRKGFTLTEMVIAILVIAILSTIAFFAGSSMMASARESRVIGDFRSIEVSAKQMLLENPEYAVLDFASDPDGDDPKTAYDVETVLNEYVDTDMAFTINASAKTDPWGNAYTGVIENTATPGVCTLTITSNGADATAVLSAVASAPLLVIVKVQTPGVAVFSITPV